MHQEQETSETWWFLHHRNTPSASVGVGLKSVFFAFLFFILLLFCNTYAKNADQSCRDSSCIDPAIRKNAFARFEHNDLHGALKELHYAVDRQKYKINPFDLFDPRAREALEQLELQQ